MSTDHLKSGPNAALDSSVALVRGSDGVHHMMIIGSMRGGKSSVVGEHVGAFLDTARLSPQQDAIDEQAKSAEAARLAAVREAFWNASNPESQEFYPLSDALTNVFDCEDPTSEQIKALFCMLPADIIGAGIQFGFADSEVRDEIWEFVEENRPAVKTALGLPD